MATLNFPSDTSQSPYQENGYTYEWDGEKWNITGTPGGGSSDTSSVIISDTPPPNPNHEDLWWDSVNGRMMIWYQDADSAQWVDASPAGSGGSGGGGGTVGNLQQVTDVGNTTTNGAYFGSGNITLSEDGSAEFAGGLTEITSDGGIISGIIEIQGDRFGSTSAISVRPTDENSGPTVTIGAAGNAEFAAGQAIIQSDAASQFVRAVDDDSNIANQHWIRGGYKTAGGHNVYTANINCDGSANFVGGRTKIFPGGHLSVETTASNQSTGVIEGTSQNGQVFQVNVAGNGRFPLGWLQSGVYAEGETADSLGVRITNSGEILSSSTVTASNAPRFRQKNGSGTTILFTNDGTASFAAGNVTLGPDAGGYFIVGGNPSNGVSEGTSLSGSGQVTVAAENDSDTLWQGYKVGEGAGNYSSLIKADGSAEFAGDVITGTIDTTDNTTASGEKLFTDGLIRVQRPGNGSSQSCFQSWTGNKMGFQAESDGTTYIGNTSDSGANTSSSNITLNADGSAEFAGNVNGAIVSGVTKDSTSDANSRWISIGDRFDVGSETDNMLAVYRGDNTIFAQIKNDGSAKFAASVTCEGYVDVTRADNSAAFQVNLTGTGATTRIFGDGKAEFAGTVTSTSANDTYSFGIKNGNTNIGGLYRSGTEDTRLILKNNTGITVDLKGADGSASFAGSVSIGGTDAAHTMDVYEEGTFTPTMDGGNPTIGNVGTISASYTRIGNVVHFVTIVAQTSNNMSFAAGNYRINGLPFIPNNTFIVNAQAMENNNALLNDLSAQVLGTNPGDIFFQVSADQSAILGSTRVLAVSGTYTTNS